MADIPILLYSTGNHFQSVLPIEYQGVKSLSLKLERERIWQSPTKISTQIKDNIPKEAENFEKCVTTQECLTLEELKGIKKKTESQKKLYEKLRKQEQRKKRNPEKILTDNLKAKEGMKKCRSNKTLEQRLDENMIEKDVELDFMSEKFKKNIVEEVWSWRILKFIKL